MPDGSVSVVILTGQRMGKLSDPLWTSIQQELKTSLLHFHALITRSKSDLYEFYYDDTGDWYGTPNRLAEGVTGLEWHGPCIIMKTKPKLDGAPFTIKDIYRDAKEFVDTISEEEEHNVEAFLVTLAKSFE